MLTNTNQPQVPATSGQFLVNGIKCELYVDDNCISWSPLRAKGNNNNKRTKRVEFAQVVGIRKIGESGELRQQHDDHPGNTVRIRCNKIKVYYSKRNKSKSSGQLLTLAKLSIASLHSPGSRRQPSEPLWQQSATALDQLSQTIDASLELKRQQRPKRLLIFVNPYGGKGKALHLYESQVRRLLDLAGIDAKLVVTEHANHARETIEDPAFDVDHFDGIVCVGGDGMFSELMNGLLFRYNRDKILAADELRRSIDGSGDDGDGDGDTIRINGANDGGSSSNCSMSGGSSDNNDDTIIGASSSPMASADDSNGSGATGNSCLRKGSLAMISRGLTKQQTNEDNNNNNNNTTSPSEKQKHNHPTDSSILELRSKLGGIGQQFVSPPIPIGVIGAGSTDANSFGLIGTNDVITAALNIILGNQIQIDVCSVHSISEDLPMRFVSTFVAYGYFGDVVRESEKLRWLGPSRYDVTGLNTLIKNKTYKGRVKILVSSQDGSPLGRERCHSNCEHCCASNTRRQQEELDDDLRSFEFIERQGSFVGVNAAVTACRCPQTKKGFSPSNHLGNGCADLILVRPCSRMQYIHYLLRTGWTKRSAFELTYVEAFRCRQFEFFSRHEQDSSSSSSSNKKLSSSASSSSSSGVSSADTHGSNSNSLDSKQSDHLSNSVGGNMSSWNVDGEILNEQSIRVKVNNQLLRVFGTGEPEKRRTNNLN